MAEQSKNGDHTSHCKIQDDLGRYLRCVTWVVSFCCVCWQACTPRKPLTTASGSTIEDPFVMECRHTLRQIATAAWVCARVGRRCAALIKVFVRPPVRPLLLLYRSAATTRQTSITVDSAAESAHKGPVWLVNVLTLVSFSCWRCTIRARHLPSERQTDIYCLSMFLLHIYVYTLAPGESLAHTHTLTSTRQCRQQYSRRQQEWQAWQTPVKPPGEAVTLDAQCRPTSQMDGHVNVVNDTDT